MAFLRNLLATLLGLFIFFFLIIFLFAGIASSTESTPTVSDNSVLHLNLFGLVTERTVDDPLQELLDGGPRPISLLDLLDAIEYAKTDDRIRGIYLQPQFLAAGYASLQELRDALLDFKTSGKFLYAYGEYLSEGDYYLVSAADSIFLNPEGSVEFNGLTAGVTFFKGMLDKLDIEPEIFRVGEFKSFVEPFIRKDMSPENELQLSELIASVHETYLTNVAANTGLQDLKKISDEMLVQSPEDAAQYGLVHRIAYEDQAISSIKKTMGVEVTDKIPLINFRKYIKAMGPDDYSSNKIAVIVASGDIVMGKADGSIGSEQFADEIRKARENKSIKAIVLRINSPGGSLTASDILWREIMLTKGVKPIIASMSDVAASGGYFMAMPCDTIVAQPNTITGSIGIFGLMFNFGDFLENKIGITSDRVNTGKYSDLMTVTRSLTPDERAIIQRNVESGYETFVNKAAAGRGMTVEEIKKVAGGRVWTGAQAKERGLVDVLGSFDDAVEIAAAKAGISDDYRVRMYPQQKPMLEKILEELSNAKASLFKVETPFDQYLEQARKLEQMRGIQARLPGELEIK